MKEYQYIKKKFDEVIDKHGTKVIYVRRDMDLHCECYSDRSRESSIYCDKCLQTGYKISLEYIKARRRIVTVVETNVALRLNYEAGVESPKAFVYYIKSEVHPKEGDIIIEYTVGPDGKKFIVKEKYIISVSAPMIANDKVTFYQTYSKYEEKGNEDDKTIQRN